MNFLLKISLITYICYLIIKSKFFEAFILFIISWNTFMLCLDDPTNENQYNIFDEFFLIVYTIEMALKIFAKGFIFNSNSYLRNFWNWIDFSIVITGYLPYLAEGNNSVNISSLRILRVIRPLRAISFLEELKKIILTILHALPNFFNVMIIFVFFLCFFGISALQLFSGVLKKRCFEQQTGLILQQSFDTSYIGVLCGYDACPDDSVCGKLIANPSYNVVNFDNIFWCLIMIFQTFTLSFNLYYIARTFNYYGALIFFTICAIIGAILLLNLMISVISSAYQAEEAKKTEKKIVKIKKEMSFVEFLQMRKLKKNSKKLEKFKVVVNFSLAYCSSSMDDILAERLCREKKMKILKFENDFNNIKFEISHKRKVLSKNNKKILPKWKKRYEKYSEKQSSTAINAIITRSFLKNKRRMNLPLKINSKLIKFHFHKAASYLSEVNLMFSEYMPRKLLKLKTFASGYEILRYKKMVRLINEPIEQPNEKYILEAFDNEECFYHIKVKFICL